MSSFSSIGLGILSACALAFAPVSSFAHGQPRVSWSVTIGTPYAVPVYQAPPAVYVQPEPVYVQPQPVYVQPEPVYIQPRPVYIAPAAVVEYRGSYPYSRHHQHMRHYDNDHGWRHSRYRH